MRESETLDWTKIVDDSRTVERAETWDDPNAIIEAAVSGYRRDNWQDQPTIVEVWSERTTLRRWSAGPASCRDDTRSRRPR